MKAKDFRHTISDINLIWNYVKGGHGRFTIKNLKTGVHHTYKVSTPKDESDKEKPLWISLMVSPDKFIFMGTIWASKVEYKHSKKTYINFGNPPALAIPWLLSYVKSNKQLPQYVGFWHEGYCGKCGRIMTNPDSLETGMGPVCSRRDFSYLAVNP